jgi:penicillin-binding protein 2
MIKDYAALQEKVSIFEGVSMRKRTFRKYPQAYGGNVMGYVGEVNDYVMKSHPEYDLGDYLGISGIESSYEEQLRGVSGRKYIVVDNRNRDVGSFANGEYDMQPVMGAELKLTIDAKLQALGEELMRGKRGSIVAIEPSTGEILALISAPNYDPNALVGRYRSRNYTVFTAIPSISPSTIEPFLPNTLQGHHSRF